MLAYVLPVLRNRALEEPLASGVELSDSQPARPNTDRQKEFMSLARTVRELHRGKVRCFWWSPNEDCGPEKTYRRHTVELAWTIEVPANPATGRIEHVFWKGMTLVLPHLARMAGGGNMIKTEGLAGAVEEVADNDSFELHCARTANDLPCGFRMTCRGSG